VNAAPGSARTYVAIAGLLAVGALFASLGAWQLDRAASSRATRAQFDGGAAEAALETLPESLDDADRFRRLELRGAYVGRQFLLDNMLHEGRAGYHVLTPLRVSGRRERVLVNRGWIPAGGDRRVLPDVEVDGAARVLSGRLERLPRPGLRLAADGDGGAPASGVVVLQYPTAADLAGRLGEPVFDYQLLLDAGRPDGFVREWRAPGVAPERHLGYAGQWFALAIGAVAAAIVIAYRTRRREP
jgi:surfeit locus 1 family protein